LLARASLRTALPIAIPVVAWSWFIVYSYPGLVTWDGVLQLGEARHGVYSDDLPALYIAIWHLVDRIVPGPGGMLVLQSTILVVGLVGLFRRVLEPLGASIAASAVLLFPPVMVPMTAVWTDSFMAALLVAGTAALLSDRRGLNVAGAAAMLVATATRYNAAAATLVPMLVVDWRPAWRGIRRYALAAAVWIAVTAAAFAADGALNDKQMHSWQTTIAVFDIVGTISHVDAPMSDDELSRVLAGTELRQSHDIQAAARMIYDPRDYFRAVADDDRAFWRVPWYDPPPPEQRDALARAWWQLVTEHPFAYLEHRLAVTRELLRDNGAAVPWRGTFREPQPERERLGLATSWPRYQVSLTHAMQRLERNSPLFTPWLFLVVAIAVAPFALRMRDFGALVASGILYEGTLVVFASSLDYRYSHWLITATTIAVVGVVARRVRARGAV
jgi:hypothetical protein